MTAILGWYRRVYDDRRYVDGARHAVVAMPVDRDAVITACGRELAGTTAAKVPNRIIPSPTELVRSDIRTCSGCVSALERSA